MTLESEHRLLLSEIARTRTSWVGGALKDEVEAICKQGLGVSRVSQEGLVGEGTLKLHIERRNLKRGEHKLHRQSLNELGL